MTTLLQPVAIKIMRSDFDRGEDLVTRFRLEHQVLAKINHPNITYLLDGGVTPSGTPYLVMEFFEGISLDQYAAAKNLGTLDRLALFLQLCSAVRVAHQNLIDHRDLKPGNLLVTSEGVPKLLDFGIAKMLSSELSEDPLMRMRIAERLMTPEYASPEQICGEHSTTATDIYGLGVLLCELPTGSRPLRLATLGPAEVERVICTTTLCLPSSPRMGPRKDCSDPVTSRCSR